MTMARTGAAPGPALPAESGPGARLLRLQRRRRLLREELLAVLFLLIALAATVAVLAFQWLGGGSASNGVQNPNPSVIGQNTVYPGGSS